MHKDTKFCYSSFDILTFGFKAPPYCTCKCPLQSQDEFEDNLEAKKISTRIVAEVLDVVLALVSNPYL